jgi:hypothetical protein
MPAARNARQAGSGSRAAERAPSRRPPGRAEDFRLNRADHQKVSVTSSLRPHPFGLLLLDPLVAPVMGPSGSGVGVGSDPSGSFQLGPILREGGNAGCPHRMLARIERGEMSFSIPAWRAWRPGHVPGPPSVEPSAGELLRSACRLLSVRRLEKSSASSSPSMPAASRYSSIRLFRGGARPSFRRWLGRSLSRASRPLPRRARTQKARTQKASPRSRLHPGG